MRATSAPCPKVLAYGVASVSGAILAVCSCTVLPLFAGIYKMGAGLGPATTFLYSGPAINVLAIILTARVLGPEMGIARAVGAVLFSVVIGLLMHLIYRKEEWAKSNGQIAMPQPQVSRPLWKNAAFFASMVGILVFANWARSGDVRAVFLCCPGGLSTYEVEGALVEESVGCSWWIGRHGTSDPCRATSRVRPVDKNLFMKRFIVPLGVTAALLVVFGGCC